MTASTGGVLLSAWAPSHRVSHANLAEQLKCNLLIATSARASFNTAMAAASMFRSLADSQEQFDLAFGEFWWDWAQGVYFLTSSIYRTVKTTPKLVLGVAKFLDSNLTDPSAMIGAAQSMIPTALYTAAMADNVARFSYNLFTAYADRDELNNIMAENARLYPQLVRNATEGARSRFFLTEQGATPPQTVPLGAPFTSTFTNGGAMSDLSKEYAKAMGYGAPSGGPKGPSVPSDVLDGKDPDQMGKDFSRENNMSASEMAEEAARQEKERQMAEEAARKGEEAAKP